MRARTEDWVFKGCVGRDRDPHLQGKVFRAVEGEKVGTELLVLGDRGTEPAELRTKAWSGAGREMRGEGGGGEGGEGERRKG